MIALATNNPHPAPRTRKLLGHLLEAILLATLAVAPLGLGGNRVWAWTVLELLVALAMLVWVAKSAADGKLALARLGGLGWAIAALMGLVALQIAPMPMSLARVISPRASALHAASHTSQGLAPPSWVVLSIAPHATRVELWKLLAAAGLFMLLVSHVRTPDRAGRLAAAVIFIGVCQALYGVAERFSEHPSIFGYVPERGFERVARGTFINSNHYASFLMVPLGLAMAWAVCLKPRRAAGTRLGHRAAALLGDPRLGKRLVSMWAALAIGTGIVLSASRGAAVACAVCALVAVALLLGGRRAWRAAALVGLVGCLAAGIALWRGYDGLGRQWTLNPRGRTAIWGETLAALADYPVAGAGRGTFRYAYPQYGETFGGLLVDHAHNEYLEWAAETGAVGLAILALGAGLYGVRFVRGFRACRSVRHRTLAVGAGLGGLAVLLHAIVDFGPRLPAVTMNLAAALALGLAWTHLHRTSGARSIRSDRGGLMRSRRWRRVAAGAVGVLVAAIAAVPVCDLAAWAEARSAGRRSDPSAAVAGCTRALAWTPRDPALLLRRARARRADVQEICRQQAAEMVERLLGPAARASAERLRVPESVTTVLAASAWADGDDRIRRRLDLAREDAWRAARLSPASPGSYLAAARAEMDLAACGTPALRRLALADRAVDQAVALAPHSPRVRFEAGRYWLRRWSLAPSAEAQAAYRRHLARAGELRRRLCRPALEAVYSATGRFEALEPLLAGQPEASRRLRKFRRACTGQDVARTAIPLPRAPEENLVGTIGGPAGTVHTEANRGRSRWDGKAGSSGRVLPTVPVAADRAPAGTEGAIGRGPQKGPGSGGDG